jgi:parallel beta-helix repeat protein
MKRKRMQITWLFLSITAVFAGCGSPPTTLPVSTAAEEIQEAASSLSEPTAMATRKDARTVQVSSDGSGDYPTLEAAITAMAPGSTIILGEGTFQIEEAVEIDKPLKLEGAGVDKTIVESKGATAAFRYTGDDLFTIRGITFRHVGNFAASVMGILAGEVDFSECRFTGGAANEDGSTGGIGLVFINDSTGVVKNCEFDENTSAGIAVAGQADPQLIENSIHDNGKDGIMITIREAGGLVEGNTLRSNGLAGRGTGTDIHVIGNYSPTLASNTCSREGYTGFSDEDWSGIVIIDTAGNIPKNTVEGNSCATLWCDASSGNMLSMTCEN